MDFDIKNPARSVVIGLILGAAAGIVITKTFKGEVCFPCVAVWSLIGAGIAYYKITV